MRNLVNLRILEDSVLLEMLAEYTDLYTKSYRSATNGKHSYKEDYKEAMNAIMAEIQRRKTVSTPQIRDGQSSDQQS